MRHNLSRTIVLLLVLVFSASCLFASAVTEGEQENKFLSLDMEKDSFSDIKQSYEDALASYDAKCEHLTEQMAKYYKAGDIEDYITARNMRRDLECPAFTQDQVKVLAKRLQEETDESVRSEFAKWLYRNSRFYRPTVTLEVSNGFSTSRYSISVEPGQAVTLPYLRYRSRTQSFLGWGIDEQTATYSEGEEITMPYSDLKLYGVFESKDKASETSETAQVEATQTEAAQTEAAQTAAAE